VDDLFLWPHDEGDALTLLDFSIAEEEAPIGGYYPPLFGYGRKRLSRKIEEEEWFVVS
jgi:hypothetical protein